MGLLEKLKSLFGADGEDQSVGSAETTVTVEREPSAESEHAVKGTDEADAFGTDGEETTAEEETDEEVPTDEPASGAESSTGETAVEAEPSPPVQEIDGIGPTYADRLADAGIETIADLRDADVATVAEATQAPESRVEDWFAQADED